MFVSGDVFGKAIVLANGACLARIRHRGQSVLSGANSSGGADVARQRVVVVPTTTVAGNAMLKCLLCCSAIALLSKMNLPLGQHLHIVLLLTNNVDGRYIKVHSGGTDVAHHLFLCSCLKKSIFVKEVHNIHLLLSTSTPFQPLLTPPLPFEWWLYCFFQPLHIYTTYRH